MNESTSKNFSIVEAFTMLIATAALLTVMLPALVQSRNAASIETCASNIRNLALASMQYEQTFKRFVALDTQWGAENRSWGIPQIVETRWSGIIALLPFIDQSSLYQRIHQGDVSDEGRLVGAIGPYGSVLSENAEQKFLHPWSIEFEPNFSQVSILKCPEDPSRSSKLLNADFARTNYAFCLGDGQIGQTLISQDVDTVRNCFQRNFYYASSSITDGLGNTLMFGEIATPEVNRGGTLIPAIAQLTDAQVRGRSVAKLDYINDKDQVQGIDVVQCRMTSSEVYGGTVPVWSNRGTRWLDCYPAYTGFTTINGPNGSSCTPASNNEYGDLDGIYSAGSYHQNGANVVFFDGHVAFMANNVDTAAPKGVSPSDYYSPGRRYDKQWYTTDNFESPSPFGVWGALGTRSSNDKKPLK